MDQLLGNERLKQTLSAAFVLCFLGSSRAELRLRFIAPHRLNGRVVGDILGLGVVPPQAEWGSMINESRAYLQLAPWSVLAPAAAVILTVMVFNYLGDAVRDLMDVSEVKA